MGVLAQAAKVAIASAEVPEAGHFPRSRVGGERACAEAGGVLFQELWSGHLWLWAGW